MASTPATAPAAANPLEGDPPRTQERHHSSNTTLSGATTTTTKDPPKLGWAQRLKGAAWRILLQVGHRTGYLEKKPRWVSETLAYSSHTSSDDDDFVDEDLHWLSGDNPDEHRLALILVEKDSTQFQAASLNALNNVGNASKPVLHPGDSQDNLVNSHHRPSHHVEGLYIRGFGPEQPHDPSTDAERGLNSFVRDLQRMPFFRKCKRYFDRFFFPGFNDPSVEAVYKDDAYRNGKVRSSATFRGPWGSRAPLSPWACVDSYDVAPWNVRTTFTEPFPGDVRPCMHRLLSRELTTLSSSFA